LDAAAKEFRRTTLVSRDMRLGMAQDCTPGWREMRNRERIGGGPSRHQKDRDLMLEQLGKTLLEAPRDRVIAVGKRGALVRGRNRGQDLRRHRRRIVACKVHRLSQVPYYAM